MKKKMIKIRRYKASDEINVKALIGSVLQSIYGKPVVDWEDFNKYVIFYLAEENGEIIGTAALKEVDNEMIKLKRMYVRVDKQHKGIGTKLLKKVLDYTKKNKFKKMILTSYPEMEIAINFYKKHGFKIVENPSDKFFTSPQLREYNKRQVAMERDL